MIHLISVDGKSARKFFLKEHLISDFKSLLRTITSGRVMVVSTKFRSDLFYSTSDPNNDSILKLWAFYANTSRLQLDSNDFNTYVGDENSLSSYFQSINTLSKNWYHYALYKKAFYNRFSNDQQNHIALTVLQCDQFLLKHTGIERTPLVGSEVKINTRLTKDTFSLAMHLLNSNTHSN